MTYNSIILIRGKSTPMHVSKSAAESLVAIFENKAIPSEHVIRVDRFTFRKGDIRSIEVNKDGSQGENWDSVAKDFYKDETEKRSKLMRLSAETKSQNLDIFFYLYKFSSSADPSEDILNKARAIQLNFFKQNPKRTICDLQLLRPLMKLTNAKRTIWEGGYFGLVERAVIRDMYLAK